MTLPAESSGFLALSHRYLGDAEPWAAPVDYNGACLPSQTRSGHWTLGAANVPARPLKPAEVAQARLFEGILLTEVAELHELACRITGSSGPQGDIDRDPPSLDLLRIQARIDEVHRLLEALRGRFPQSQCEGGLQSE
jgi:hypothetical protein